MVRGGGDTVLCRAALWVRMPGSEELLKPIYHAFSALDGDKSGRVSKSQLKVRL